MSWQFCTLHNTSPCKPVLQPHLPWARQHMCSELLTLQCCCVFRVSGAVKAWSTLLVQHSTLGSRSLDIDTMDIRPGHPLHQLAHLHLASQHQNAKPHLPKSVRTVCHYSVPPHPTNLHVLIATTGARCGIQVPVPQKAAILQ